MAQNPFEQALADEGLVGTPLESLARSIYMQESSGGKNTKTSNAGAVGGMQILPSTFQEVLPGGNINDPYQNSVAGLRYIKKLSGMAGGDPSLVAAGYYGGPGGMQKAKQGVAVRDPRNPNAPTTLEYAKQVTERQGKTVSRETLKPESVIADAGEGYQAAYALMAMADEEPETEREIEAREAAEEQSAAQQFAAIQKQLASVKPASPFAAQEPQEFNQGGEALADAQGSAGGFERWLATKMGVDKAWDKSLEAPYEMGLSEDSGTRGDAVRHMTLMREIEKKYNPTVAKTLGYAHEFIGGPMQYFSNGEPQSSRDREMDLRNNALGLELSKQAGGDDAKFKELMRQALENKQADFYREEYTGKRSMPGATKVRKRAEGSPEMGEVSGRTFEEGGPETAKKMLKDVARGVQFYPYDLVGAPVDIINMGLKGVDYVTGSKLATDKPVGGSADLIDRFNKIGIAEKPTGSAAEELARLGSAFINPASGARATGKVLGKAGQLGKDVLEDLSMATTGQGGSKMAQLVTSQAQPAFAVRPKGGLYLGAQDVKSAPLDTFDQEVVSLAKNIDATDPLDKSILDFFDKKVRKYVQTQRGTPEDPIFNAYIKGRLEPNTMMFRDYLNKAQEGDASSLRTARDYYDMSLGMTNIIPTKTAEVMAKGKSPYAYSGELDRRIADLIKKQKPDEPSTWSSTAMVDPQAIKEKPALFDFPGVKQLVQESEAGKLMRMLNKTDLPPHLRQAATSGEYVTQSYGNINLAGEPTFVGNLSVRELKDYLQTKTPNEIKNMGIEDAAVKAEQWRDLLEEARVNPQKVAHRLGPKYLLKGTDTVMPSLKNMQWVDVKTPEALTLEGNLMGHCVGGPSYLEAVKKGVTKIYSLRDQRGVPHVTVELAKDADGTFGIVSQIKGTADTAPEKYFNHVNDFLDKYQDTINKKIRITEEDKYLPFERRAYPPKTVRYIDQNGVQVEEVLNRDDPNYFDFIDNVD